MKKILIIVLVFLSGCATIYSGFDGVALVWKQGIEISRVEKPEGFNVAPSEVHSLVEPMKFSWHIYADEDNYYLSSLRNLYPGLGNNSYYAKISGYKVCGVKRDMYELLRNRLGEGKARPIQTLSDLVKDAGC